MATPFESFLAGFRTIQDASSQRAEEKYRDQTLLQRLLEAKDARSYRDASLAQSAEQFNAREANAQSRFESEQGIESERWRAEQEAEAAQFREREGRLERTAELNAGRNLVDPEDFARWQQIVRGGTPSGEVGAIPSGPLSTLLQVEGFRNKGASSGGRASNNPYAGISDTATLTATRDALAGTVARLQELQRPGDRGATVSDRIGAAKALPKTLEELARVNARLAELGVSGATDTAGDPLGGAGFRFNPNASIRPQATHSSAAPRAAAQIDPQQLPDEQRLDLARQAFRQMREQGTSDDVILDSLIANYRRGSLSQEYIDSIMSDLGL